jgi:nitrate reductase delta subunit
MMLITFKALGALLQYPTPDLVSAAGEISNVLKEEALVSQEDLAAIDRLIVGLTVGDLLKVQEDYVGLFDRSRSLSLHLFEHVHGESRDRGQAMVNLIAHYEANGYSIEANELPDFLPLFLEFLSLLEGNEPADLLSDVVHILAAIKIRLERRDSAYAVIFEILESLAKTKPEKGLVASLLANDKSPKKEQEDLDSEWEEAPAFSGAPEGECPASREVLNRMSELSVDVSPPQAKGA